MLKGSILFQENNFINIIDKLLVKKKCMLPGSGGKYDMGHERQMAQFKAEVAQRGVRYCFFPLKYFKSCGCSLPKY